MISENKLKNVKLVVLDLDGTLLKSDGTIGQKTKEIIRELQDHGVRFSFASGRLHSAVVKYAEELNIKNEIISLDGSMIKTFPDNIEVYKSVIPKRYVKKALNLCNKTLVNVALCHADAIYYTQDNELIPTLLEKFGAKYTLVDSYDDYIDGTLELAFAGDSRQNVRMIENKLTFPYAFGLNAIFYKSHTHGGVYYLEVRKQGSTKATGLIKLAKRLKIKIEDCVVMGDWYNDRDLFETKAVKVAMQNAVPEILSLADTVTQATNDEEGVAEFLEKILKAKK